MSTRTISPLRQRMIEDMTARKLAPQTQHIHIASCKRFAAFLQRSPETATVDDICRFQLQLAESGMEIAYRNRIVTGVKFLFRVTLRRHDLAAEMYHLAEPRKIPVVMSQAEVKDLLAAAKTLKFRVMLSLTYGCGLRISEIVKLRGGDIDSSQNIIRIIQAKGHKDRHVMLPPEVLKLLRQWWGERPTKYDAGVPKAERYLFPSLRARTHVVDAELDELERQHVRDAALLDELGRLTDALASAEGARRIELTSELGEAMGRYAELHWEHMGREEAVILPAAQQHLQAEDWATLNAAFAEAGEMPNGALTGLDYRHLLSRIV